MNITILVMNFNDIDVTFPEFIYTVLYILVFVLLSLHILMKLGEKKKWKIVCREATKLLKVMYKDEKGLFNLPYIKVVN